MIKLFYNINVLLILIILMIGIQSCSNEWEEAKNVEVSFTAILPNDVQSRTLGEGIHVDTLVVGIFAGNTEIERKYFSVKGENVNVQLTLAQNQIYNFVFWAYNRNHNFYNIKDLTAIKMNDLPDLVSFSTMEAADAFFAIIKNYEVKDGENKPIVLTRPLSQINVGTVGTPLPAMFTAKDVPNTFHPFTNDVSGAAEYTWNFSEITTEKFSVEGMEYTYLAMSYVFAPIDEMFIATELTLQDGKNNQTIPLPKAKIQANKKSNIIGNLTN